MGIPSRGTVKPTFAASPGTWYINTLTKEVWCNIDGTAGGWTAAAHKNTLDATVDPVVTDDSDSGYSPGSVWLNTSSGELFQCVDAPVGAAVWKKTSGGGSDIGCRAGISSAQSIPDSVFTAINLNAEDYDTDAMHDIAVNNERITFKTAGKYIVTYTCEFAVNGTGVRVTSIRKNGVSDIAAIGPISGDATFESLVSSAFEDEFSESDYIVMRVAQSSGGALDATRAVVTARKVDKAG